MATASGGLVLEIKRNRDLFKKFADFQKVRADNIILAYAEQATALMQSEISSSIWPVGFESARWAGGYSEAGPIRDIVDSGTLRDSFMINFSDSRSSSRMEIVNTSGYASAVRFGYATQRSPYSPVKDSVPFTSRTMPGRDFVATTLAIFPFSAFVASYKESAKSLPSISMKSPSVFFGKSLLS
jgi:hypothetical protein